MNALAKRIKRRIALNGPLSVAAFMASCLGDPDHGYYRTKEPFGPAGDFVTAPEISQMFGELIGVWCLTAWEAMEQPDAFHLVELGPGRGTLMADLLRAAAVRPRFVKAATVHLIETSPRLRQAQARKLAGLTEPRWHDDWTRLPEGPLILVANEFFDALPVHQYIKTTQGWHERVIALNEKGALCFGIGPAKVSASILPTDAGTMPTGSIFEVSPASEAIFEALARKTVTHGGAILVIDYGSLKSGYGDTLQAVSRHHYADVLARPGAQDLTAHVNFESLAQRAAFAGARVHGPTRQGAFLLDLGLRERAGALGRHADAPTRQSLIEAVERLAGPAAMGDIFKVLAASHPSLDLPGFTGKASS